MKKLIKSHMLLVAFLLSSMMLLNSCDSMLGDGTRIDKVLTAKAGGNISIDMSIGDISVGISSDDKVHITYYEYDRVKYNIIQNNDGFSINQTIERPLHTSGKVKGVTVLVPKEVVYGTFSIDASTGDITIKDISVSSFNVDSNTGAITIKDISANSFNVDSTTGDIELERVSSTGDIRLDLITGYVSGSIVARQTHEKKLDTQIKMLYTG